MTLAGVVEAAGLARDAFRVRRLLKEIDPARWEEGPGLLVSRMRERGASEPTRSPANRRRLEGLIYRLDRIVAGGPNCYRRALVRIALDPEAAEGPFVLGLNVPPTPATANRGGDPHGHAWVESTRPDAQPDAPPAERFDVEFRL
jgi:hypothetical protein